MNLNMFRILPNQDDLSILIPIVISVGGSTDRILTVNQRLIAIRVGNANEHDGCGRGPNAMQQEFLPIGRAFRIDSHDVASR
jgi:hypothetical protein